jgi:hypothetical protein
MLTTRAELERRYDWFILGQRASSFEGARELEFLKAQAHAGFEVYAFIGAWCPDTQIQAPGFCKLMDQAQLKESCLKWIELGRDKKFLPWTQDYRIEKVPTFIFLKNGQEIGRITESPRGSLLEDSAQILGLRQT